MFKFIKTEWLIWLRNEKRNSEKTEIKIEGIKVNSEKKVIYLKLVVFFLVSILIFNEFLISINR